MHCRPSNLANSHEYHPHPPPSPPPNQTDAYPHTHTVNKIKYVPHFSAFFLKLTSASYPTWESATAFSGSSLSSEEAQLLRLLEDFRCHVNSRV